MNHDLAEELAETAIHRKELEADRPVADEWRATLINCIFLANQAGPTRMRRELALGDKVGHPEKDVKLTVGEVLSMFGLIKDINTGVVWNDG